MVVSMAVVTAYMLVVFVVLGWGHGKSNHDDDGGSNDILLASGFPYRPVH